MSKKCRVCGETFPHTSEFFYRKLGKLRNECKECSKSITKKWKEENKEHVQVYKEKYRKENKEKELNYSREYYRQNKEKERIRLKKYYNDNRDWYLEYSKKYRKENREYFSNWLSEKRKTCPLFSLKERTRNIIRLSITRLGYSKKSKLNSILGCGWDLFYKHMCTSFEYNYGIGREYIPWDMVHIDHIIPISHASTEQEVMELNHFSNLQLLLAEDNISKKDNINWEIH